MLIDDYELTRQIEQMNDVNRDDVIALIARQKPVDAEPVKHGHWIDVNGDGSLWRCSVCGELQCCESNYCGDCGARMDGDRDERTKRL